MDGDTADAEMDGVWDILGHSMWDRLGHNMRGNRRGHNMNTCTGDLSGIFLPIDGCTPIRKVTSGSRTN